ncbi:MAG: DUF2334 domain-containing protein [Desulfosporosinus sp.]|nr:DUF2334 domain-containing protein [Desulfosporosinus sp.]
MGKAKYIFRLDDISWKMNFSNFNRFREILEKSNIKPLIGVIPANKDAGLIKAATSSGIGEKEFWEMLYRLHRECGWNIALHGYDHVYISKKAGLLKVHFRSEFAGLGEEEQNQKILQGKKILEEKGLRVAAFMAPAHTFDQTTEMVLERNGITVVTDGYGIYPYKKRGITFVPQLFARPRKMPFGVYTFCFHPNSMTDEEFERVERFIDQNSSDIISFEEAAKILADDVFKKTINIGVRLAMYGRALIRLMYNK